MKYIKKLYDWVLSWAHTPYAVPALFVLAFAESSFFPIPPDVLLIALAIALPARAYYYALITSVGSVLGGAFGYLIGMTFMESVGFKIIGFYGLASKYDDIKILYDEHAIATVSAAGFTPIPYKLITIAAGAFDINFYTFIIASTISRSARFFLVAALIYFYGAKIKEFIDKYFNILTVVFTVMLVLGFVAIKFIGH